MRLKRLMKKQKTSSDAWEAREASYRNFIEHSKHRPNKVCHGVSSSDRKEVNRILDLVTVRVRDLLPE